MGKYLILLKERGEREAWGFSQPENKFIPGPIILVIKPDKVKMICGEYGEISKAKELSNQWVIIYSDHENADSKRKNLKKNLSELVKDANPRIFHHGGGLNPSTATQQDVLAKFKPFSEAGFSNLEDNVRYFSKNGDFSWDTLMGDASKEVPNGDFNLLITHLDKAWDKASDRFGSDQNDKQRKDATKQNQEDKLNGIRAELDKVLIKVIPRMMALRVELDTNIDNQETLTGEDFKHAFETYKVSDKDLHEWVSKFSSLQSWVDNIDDSNQKEKLSNLVVSGVLLLLSYELFSKRYTQYFGLADNLPEEGAPSP